MNFAELSDRIFTEATKAYHLTDSVDAPQPNPYPAETVEHTLFAKNWIDVVQWHLEDLIRDPKILPEEVVALKRRIDKSNQDRTDMVEELDTYFLNTYGGVKTLPDATINTESPAWALDRLSILAVKIYHMLEQTQRTDVDENHLQRCCRKLDILRQQRIDLITAIDQLLADFAAGRKYMKVYRQMKMYNDPSTNPVLYGAKK